MGHLGAGDVGAGGGNASSCTFDPCVLIHVCFTVGLTRGRRNTLCSTWRVAVSGPRPIPSPDGGGGRVPQSSLLGLGQAYGGLWDLLPATARNIYSNTVQCVKSLCFSPSRG